MSRHLHIVVLSLSTSFGATHAKEVSCTSKEQAVDPAMRVRNSVAPHGQSNVVMLQLRRQFHERWRGLAAVTDHRDIMYCSNPSSAVGIALCLFQVHTVMIARTLLV